MRFVNLSGPIPVMSESDRRAIEIGEKIHDLVKKEAQAAGLHGVLLHGERSSGFRRFNHRTHELDDCFSDDLKNIIRKHKAELKIYAKWRDGQTVASSPVKFIT